MHICPMVTGTVPHVGGPVLPPGAPKVLIGGVPAARLGDKATCVGPPDTIAQGSATVLIGGMPAARMGDSTVHGGKIAIGCPTVIIGDSGGGGGSPQVVALQAAAASGGSFAERTVARADATRTKRQEPDAAVPCELVSAGIKCGHGRSPSPDGILEVVPGTSDAGDRIELTATMNGSCAEHPLWAIAGGLLTTRNKGTSSSFRTTPWRPNQGTNVWAGHVTGHAWQIGVRGCHGVRKSFQLRSYPNNKVTLNVQLHDFAKKFNDLVEDILKVFLPNLSITVAKGAFQYTAEWKEHTDHRAYFAYDIHFGFAPLIEVKYRQTIGPTAIIPPKLKQYLPADGGFFVELAGRLDLTAGFSRENPDRTRARADSSGFIRGSVGVELHVWSKDVLEVEGSGGTGIALQIRTEEQPEPCLAARLDWEGLALRVTVKALWGRVEFEEECRLVEPRTIHTFRLNVPELVAKYV